MTKCNQFINFTLLFYFFVALSSLTAQELDFTKISAEVNFSEKLRLWDGFGVNYVETSQTFDYDEWPQDYGGFSFLKNDEFIVDNRIQRRYIVNAHFALEEHGNIYEAKVSGLNPWPFIQTVSQWIRPDPNPGSAIRVYDDGSWEIRLLILQTTNPSQKKGNACY